MNPKIIITSTLLVITLSCFLFLRNHNNTSINHITKPNILLITVCSLRQDHLGIYGYSRDTSPVIDKFAATATVYTNAYTHIPWTKPSVISLMEGRYPSQSKTAKRQQPLAVRLKSLGYQTWGIVGTNVAKTDAQADTGFDIFLDNSTLPTSKDIHTVQADTIINNSIKLLSDSSNINKPVFLWLFFKDPHWPYLPPAEYRNKFMNDDLYKNGHQELILNKHSHNSINGIGEARLYDSNKQPITDKAYYITQYDAEIAYLDNQIGRILSYLKQKGQYDDWIIILSSDHGESLGENNYFFDHGYKLSQGTIKIPLIIKSSRQAKNNKKNTSISISDINPTLLNMLGKNIARRNPPERMIMLENSPFHERENEKLLGCILMPYKYIYKPKSNEAKFYNIPEGTIENSEEGIQINKKTTRKILDAVNNFFKDSLQDINNIKDLRTLGYLQ